MNLTDEQIDIFNGLYHKATSTMEGLVSLNNYRPQEPTNEEKKRIYEAIYYFKEALDIYAEHFASLFFLGKLYQRLGEFEKALESIEIAMQYEHENYNFPMEAALMAMHLGKIDYALQLSAMSVKLSPGNPVTMGNHATNLMVAGDDDKALAIINEALKLDPTDSINQNIKKKIEAVISGAVKRPLFTELI